MVRRRCVRALASAIGVALLLTGVVSAPPAAALDVYTTPGTHHVNGRTWRTTCSNYSTTVERCRTEIIATTISASGNTFRSVKGWTFNNLTYLPSPRGPWKGNPLATPGEHRIDGRLWRTECDTAVTGRNGCRSYIQASVVDVIASNPVRHGWKTTWVFNNMVRFSTGSVPSRPTTPQPPKPPTTSCEGVPLPSGWNVGKDGMPSPPASGQFPANAHNPQYIGNFIRQVLKDDRTSTSQKQCLATTAAGHLIARSTTRVTNGATSRWYPFDFAYSANPAVPALKAPWYSGLAQANILTVTSLMEDLTGDPVWRRYGKETFEAFMVPTSQGGFTARDKGFLWFEECPTTPGTSVLNDHLEALIGLTWWGQNMAEPRATALVNEAVEDLRPLLETSEVDVQAGLLTSYDLLRGYPAAPLRLLGSPGFRWDQSRLNGASQGITTVMAGTPAAPNVLLNSTMSTTSNGLPTHWRALGARSQVSATNGVARVVTDGRDWQGLVQSVAAGTFTPEEPLHLGVRSRLTVPTNGPGTSGKVMAYEKCSGRYRVLHTTAKLRSSAWVSHDLGFPAPRAGCSLEIRLTSGNQGPANTVVEFDDVVLSRADDIGGATTPRYDLRVDRTPDNAFSLTGVGTATLQAHADGRWHNVADVTLTGNIPAKVVLPERFTGRNLHYGYHENHVSELMQLHRMTGKPMFLEFARRWAPLAPAHNGLVP